MTVEPDLRVVSACKGCGTLNEEAHDLLEQKEEALRDLELDLRKLRARVKTLKGDQQKGEKNDPYFDDAWACFRYWREILAPRAKEFTGERFSFTVARLRAGWDVADICKAIDGAKAGPPDRRSDDRKTDLTSIVRNEKNLMMFMDWADAARAPEVDPEQQKLQEAFEQAQVRMVQQARTVVPRLLQLRGWTEDAVAELELGLGSDGRIVIPARDAAGRLVGAVRYAPNPETRTGPKSLAVGPRELFPSPESFGDDVGTVWLVEGESDPVSMWSMQLPAIGKPGAGTWKKDWGARFARFDRVVICYDCDDEGREAAARDQAALAPYVEVDVVDIDKNRNDRYDVGDLLVEKGRQQAASTLRALSGSSEQQLLHLHRPKPQSRADIDHRSPLEKVESAMRSVDCELKQQRPGQYVARCPAHDDRHASLSLAEGDDETILLTCHAGCEPKDIVHAIGLEFRDLFARRAS